MSESVRIAAEQVRAASAFSAATLHEAAGQIGALPAAIKPIAPGLRLCGLAATVAAAPLDNLWLHRALASAPAGAILVATVGGVHEAGYWGDVMTTAARARGLGGLVIDGCVRDRRSILASGFPVFARGISVRGTAKAAPPPGRVGGIIRMGEAAIAPGDLIVGDDDGVVAVPASAVAETLEAARARVAKEADVMRELERGRTTLEIYGWD